MGSDKVHITLLLKLYMYTVGARGPVRSQAAVVMHVSLEILFPHFWTVRSMGDASSCKSILYKSRGMIKILGF